MFSKNDRASGDRGIPSIIGTSMRVAGDLHSEGSVQIEGVIEGDVRCAEVTVGREATIRGQIHAETANIHGNVDGEICAQRVTLSSTARVVGDIVHEEVAIEAGAYVEGSCCAATRNSPGSISSSATTPRRRPDIP